MADKADGRARLLGELVAPLRVKPGRTVTLAKDFDPCHKAHFVDKDDADEFLSEGVALLSEYQEKLAAQDIWGVLVCLQALDAAGKDGTIRHVMSGVNPQGVQVHSFKVPSVEELDHDFLWRYNQHLPARGDIAIFNRSHYEEVLVVRVHPENLERQRLPKRDRGEGVWERRYRDINNWERHLVDNGFRVVKIFLNVSREEQRQRFLERIEEPNKNWKFSLNDVTERRCWDGYQAAFSEMLSKTSTDWAPWYVVPGDHKWFARICVSAILTLTLMEIDPRFPQVGPEKLQELAEARRQLEAEASEGTAEAACSDGAVGAPADAPGPGPATKPAGRPGKKARKKE
jgi:PPK2 family polyphosphate:nucleotide phosphotransferase